MKVTAQARTAFLDKLRDTANVSLAAREAGHPRQTWYKFKEADPEFADAWADALEEATDDLEAVARRRAKEGFDRAVFYKGQIVGTVRDYSDQLMVTLLRAHLPPKTRSLTVSAPTIHNTVTRKGGAGQL